MADFVIANGIWISVTSDGLFCVLKKLRFDIPLSKISRQSDVYKREGIDVDVSTLADWVGAAAATLMPLVDVIRSHVFGADRIHADDTTVPVLAKGKTRIGRLWT